MAKVKKTSSESVRVTLYFSEEDKKLLDFVDSQELKRSTYIMSLIKRAYNEQLTTKTDITNTELLNELKQFITTNSLKSDQIQKETRERKPIIDYSKIPYDNIEL